MRRVLMKQIKEILKLKYQMDFSYRRIAKSLGVSRSAAAEYCRSIIPQENKNEKIRFLFLKS